MKLSERNRNQLEQTSLVRTSSDTSYGGIRDGDKLIVSQLIQIFANKDAFELYIAHLSKEFSMEFLLALVEIIQLQTYILSQDIQHDHVLSEGLLCKSVRFYDEIPKSLIVFQQAENANNVDVLIKIKRKSNELYFKYIEGGAPHEILLSDATRNNVSDVMSHLDWIEDDEIGVDVILQLW
eukprot:CAMPEP_0197033926 /NCGR_PEP_ID=MMETSP1384-20130603/12181_1 /TAXON_ID=29189 /ORGANISM="Ammonia sp." /LENGTH=180 /DNA_ID=CAMNT_0042463789 /DNA_START=933 /DNA_END=1472 /DNA_ORIENTATION=+